MPAPLIALLAAAMYQSQKGGAEPVSLDQTLALLARATEGNPITIASAPDGIRVNGVFLPLASPGSQLIAEAFAAHGTSQIQLPSGMESRLWREVAAVYSSPHERYPTVASVLAALRPSMPLVEIWGIGDQSPIPIVPGTRGPISEVTGSPVETGVTNRADALSAFSAHLTQLFAEGTTAAERDDVEGIARVLLEFQTLEKGTDSFHASIIATERRRIVTSTVLEWLIRSASRPDISPKVPEAVASLGTTALQNVLQAVADAPGPRERAALAEVFAHVPNLSALLVLSLRGGETAIVRGAAEIAGRRQLAEAVPILSGLLRAREEEVRTAAWHALESIGTREAIAALSSRGR